MNWGNFFDHRVLRIKREQEKWWKPQERPSAFLLSKGTCVRITVWFTKYMIMIRHWHSSFHHLKSVRNQMIRKLLLTKPAVVSAILLACSVYFFLILCFVLWPRYVCVYLQLLACCLFSSAVLKLHRHICMAWGKGADVRSFSCLVALLTLQRNAISGSLWRCWVLGRQGNG